MEAVLRGDGRRALPGERGWPSLRVRKALEVSSPIPTIAASNTGRVVRQMSAGDLRDTEDVHSKLI